MLWKLCFYEMYVLCRNFHAYEADEFYNSTPEIFSEVNEAIDHARSQNLFRKKNSTNSGPLKIHQKNIGPISRHKHQSLYTGYASQQNRDNPRSKILTDKPRKHEDKEKIDLRIQNTSANLEPFKTLNSKIEFSEIHSNNQFFDPEAADLDVIDVKRPSERVFGREEDYILMIEDQEIPKSFKKLSKDLDLSNLGVIERRASQITSSNDFKCKSSEKTSLTSANTTKIPIYNGGLHRLNLEMADNEIKSILSPDVGINKLKNSKKKVIFEKYKHDSKDKIRSDEIGLDQNEYLADLDEVLHKSNKHKTNTKKECIDDLTFKTHQNQLFQKYKRDSKTSNEKTNYCEKKENLYQKSMKQTPDEAISGSHKHTKTNPNPYHISSRLRLDQETHAITRPYSSISLFLYAHNDHLSKMTSYSNESNKNMQFTESERQNLPIGESGSTKADSGPFLHPSWKKTFNYPLQSRNSEISSDCWIKSEDSNKKLSYDYTRPNNIQSLIEKNHKERKRTDSQHSLHNIDYPSIYSNENQLKMDFNNNLCRQFFFKNITSSNQISNECATSNHNILHDENISESENRCQNSNKSIKKSSNTSNSSIERNTYPRNLTEKDELIQNIVENSDKWALLQSLKNSLSDYRDSKERLNVANFHGFGTVVTPRFPGPTLIFPDFGPVIALFADREAFLYAEIGDLVNKSLVDVSTAIDKYILTASAAVNAPILAGVTRIKDGLISLFTQTADVLNLGIKAVFTNVRAELTTNASVIDAQIITQFNTMLDSALQESLTRADGFILAAIDRIQNYINTSGSNLLQQLTGILANTTNTSAILPQLDFLSQDVVQTILGDTFELFTKEISDIITSGYVSMQPLLQQSLQNLVSQQTAVLGSVEPQIIAIITDEVTSLLNDVKILIDTESAVISDEAALVLRASQPTLESEITLAINVLRSGIQSLFNQNFAEIIAQMNQLLDADEASLVTQVETIFATE